MFCTVIQHGESDRRLSEGEEIAGFDKTVTHLRVRIPNVFLGSGTAPMLKVKGSICSAQFGSLKHVTQDSTQCKSAVAEGHAESTRLMNWKMQ